MSDLNVKALSQELEAAISGLSQGAKLEQSGVVTRVSDGIVWVYGLRDCGFSDVLEIETTDGAPARAFAGDVVFRMPVHAPAPSGDHDRTFVLMVFGFADDLVDL